MRKAAALFILFAAIATATPAFASFELEGYYWLMSLEGDASAGFAGVEGTEVDLEDDLGYDDAEGIAGFTLIAGGDHHQIGVNYFSLDMSQANRLERNVNFRDEFFPATTVVNSELEATFIRGFYRLKVGSDRLHGGLIAGGQYINVDATLSSTLFGTTAARDVNTGSPLVGLHIGGQPWPYFAFYASLVGASWEVNDIKTDIADIEVSGRLMSKWGGYLGAGYRHIVLEASDDSSLVDVDITFSGPAAYVGFNW